MERLYGWLLLSYGTIVTLVFAADGPLPDTAALDHYRIAQLEAQMQTASAERQWILGLLIANLVAVVFALIARRRNGRNGRSSTTAS